VRCSSQPIKGWLASLALLTRLQLNLGVRYRPINEIVREPSEAELWRVFERFDANELPLTELEAWLYANADLLERVLGKDQALDLLSKDFRAKHARHAVLTFVTAAYDAHRPDQLRIDCAIRVLEEFLGGERDIWRTSRTLAALRFEGPDESWIPDEFVYIDSELDLIPAPDQRHHWEPVALEELMREKEPILAEYIRAAQEVGRDLLSRLETARRDT
jgi:hypothetical protein